MTLDHANENLTSDQIDSFIRDGFLRMDNAFWSETAAAAREILWRDSGCDPNDRSTWTKPVIRLWDYPQQPFREAANTPVLHSAFDALVGKGRWVPRESLGTFPIRFPHLDDPGDTGWHVDASFPPDPPTDNYLHWRININSKGRALLMLFLFSDVADRTRPPAFESDRTSPWHAYSLLPVSRACRWSTSPPQPPPRPRTQKKYQPRAPQELSISATRFFCMQLNRIAVKHHASWLNPRSPRVFRSSCLVLTPTTLRSSRQSVSRLA